MKIWSISSVGNVELQKVHFSKMEKGDSFPHTASKSRVVGRQILGNEQGKTVVQVYIMSLGLTWRRLTTCLALRITLSRNPGQVWIVYKRTVADINILWKNIQSLITLLGEACHAPSLWKKRKKRHSHSKPIYME